MKKEIKLFVCLLGFGLFTERAFAADEDMRAYQKICDYIKIDDRGSLRRTLEDLDIDLRKEYGDIKCGKLPLLKFAISNGSVEAGTMIAMKLGKLVGQKDSDGLSSLDYAKKQLEASNNISRPRIETLIDVIQSKL